LAGASLKLLTLHHLLIEDLERETVRLSHADAAQHLVVLSLVGEAHAVLVDHDRAGGEGEQQRRNFVGVVDHIGIVADAAAKRARHMAEVGVPGAERCGHDQTVAGVADTAMLHGVGEFGRVDLQQFAAAREAAGGEHHATGNADPDLATPIGHDRPVHPPVSGDRRSRRPAAWAKKWIRELASAASCRAAIARPVPV
jgi:hypothetical protein